MFHMEFISARPLDPEVKGDEKREVKGSRFLNFFSVYKPKRCTCFLLLDAPVGRAGWFGGGQVRSGAEDNV